MNNCHFFIEYEWQRSIDIPIPTVFFERGFCEKSNSGSVRFKVTGLLEHNDKFFIIFPKGMNIPTHTKEKVLKTQMLLKTLNKYASTNILDAEESTWMGSNDSSRLFEITEWLIEDYKQNRLIHTHRRKEQINGNGRIEWSKSIQKKAPIVMKNKLYYLDLITSKNDIVSDQELTSIHSLVLKLVSDTYGWLFDFHYFNDFPNENHSKKYMLYILNKALKNTYIDREIRLFKNLITFLNRKAKSDLIHVFATGYFANIWEVACAKFFDDIRDLHNMVPNPYWVYEGKKTHTSQIPDILLNNDNNIVIFDAKYYRIKEGIDKLPGWGDIVKQLFYAMSFKESTRQIYNAFLFPSSYALGYKYLGYASVDNKENEFGKVLAFGMDVQMVLSQYIGEIRDTSTQQIVKNLLSEVEVLQIINQS